MKLFFEILISSYIALTGFYFLYCFMYGNPFPPKSSKPKHVHDWGPWTQENAKVHGKTMFGPMQTIKTTVQCRTCKTCGYQEIRTPFD
jgi:hypothetical protein